MIDIDYWSEEALALNKGRNPKYFSHESRIHPGFHNEFKIKESDFRATSGNGIIVRKCPVCKEENAFLREELDNHYYHASSGCKMHLTPDISTPV